MIWSISFGLEERTAVGVGYFAKNPSIARTFTFALRHVTSGRMKSTISTGSEHTLLVEALSPKALVEVVC